MSISDKLAAIAANVPAVYAAGAAAGKRAAALESDAQIVSVLIEAYGARAALKKFTQINADSGDLTELADRFFTAAAKSVSGTYTLYLTQNPQKYWRRGRCTAPWRCL